MSLIFTSADGVESVPDRQHSFQVAVMLHNARRANPEIPSELDGILQDLMETHRFYVCPVCLDLVMQSRRNRGCRLCHHVTHRACAITLDKCPCCRHPF